MNFKAFRKSDDARVDITLESDESRANWSGSVEWRRFRAVTEPDPEEDAEEDGPSGESFETFREDIPTITIDPAVTREFEIRQRLTSALSKAGYAVLP